MAVRAPRILPGTSTINSETLIEIQTPTPGAAIFFTVDGSKPDIRKRPGAKSSSTLTFTHPFKVWDTIIHTHIRRLSVSCCIWQRGNRVFGASNAPRASAGLFCSRCSVLRWLPSLKLRRYT